MLKRIFACLFILAVFPLLPLPSHDRNQQAPFATVAFAGHVNTGSGRMSCECGCSVGCECDPGETPGDCININRATSPNADGAADRVAVPGKKTGHSGLDFGTGTLMLIMALWLWVRLRA